jgi:biopolymer transport protein ExbD
MSRGEAMKKFSKSHHGTMNELNITPLLDLAFVLLVIFIISTAPMVNDLDLNLPTKNKPQKAPQQLPHFIVVEPDGSIFLDTQPMVIGRLRMILEQLKRKDAETSVVVHGDAAVVYQVMVDVFDALQHADIKKVGLAMEKPTPAVLERLLKSLEQPATN